METESVEEILEATRHALCEHGYADLTVQRIADESSMTSAAIHYHFDTKTELLNAFLDYFTDEFERQLACEDDDPRKRLETFLSVVFEPAENGDDDFAIALMELKTQAPYQDTYRERFVAVDERMRAAVAEAVRDGIEAGHFEPVDPDAVARFVVTTINGGHVREVALGERLAETRRIIESYLEARLGWAPEVST
ncbi:TetR/AcrR family transcriptional regulator [Natronomonas amylolytica]|uniref:TetR/AcrR family transcriptional regulator n=1 Tax=Natronomonas amylolytica TaxID=3108498 RepID=UPI003008A3F5